MALSVRAVERDIARQRAKIERFRHEVACFEEGKSAHEAAISQLYWAECSLNADTKLVAWMKRRLALFRALDVERCMEQPQVID